MKFVLTLANLNLFALKMTFCIVKANRTIIMELITLIQPLEDVLQFMTLNTQMVHVYQAALTHTEMNGITAHISAILLVLIDISIS